MRSIPYSAQCQIHASGWDWFSNKIHRKRIGNMDFYRFKGTVSAFSDFKNKQNSVWSNLFWYAKVYIFWKCIEYTIYWYNTQMLKNIP